MKNVVMLAAYFWIVRKWRYFYYFHIFVHNIAGFVLLFWISESPQYLYNKRDFTEFRKVMDRIFKINGKPIPANYKLKAESNDPDATVCSNEEPPTKLELLKYKEIWLNLVITIINFVAISFSYYMMALFVKRPSR